MTLKNNTGSAISNVVLRRQVDVDVDSGGVDGWVSFSNWHAVTTRTSVFAFNDRSAAPPDKEAHAMQLRCLGADASTHQAAFVTDNILDTTCHADSRKPSGPTFSDTMIFPIGRISARASRFAAVEYSRF